MRRRSRWVLPALTALCVAAAALVPPGLSRLEDRRTETAVHSEDLTGDNNFSVWRPAMGERVGLVARWLNAGEGVSAAAWELTGESVRQSLELLCARLTELAGITGGEFDPAQFTVARAVRNDLWPEGELGGMSMLAVSAYGAEDPHCYLSGMLDEESGQLMQLYLEWPEYRSEYTPAETAGRAFLDRLGVEYELLRAGEYQAFFVLADGENGYQCVSNESFLLVTPDEIGYIQKLCEEAFRYEEETVSGQHKEG